MKRLSFALLAYFALIGYQISAADTGHRYDFLSKLGIEVTPKLLVGDHFAGVDDDCKWIPLGEEARRALLRDAVSTDYEYDDGELHEIIGLEIGIAVVGVRPLPHDLTLVLFAFEHGDGGTSAIGIYDHTGKRLSYLDNGPSGGTYTYDIDEAHTHIRVGYTTVLDFEGDSKFSLTFTLSKSRTFTSPDGTINEWGVANYVETATATDWTMTKTYRYAISDNGVITLKRIPKPKCEGDVDEFYITRDELNELHFYPAGDTRQLQRLDKMARLIPPATDREYDDIYYQVRYITRDIYMSNPTAFYNYILSHRTSHKLIDMLFELAGDAVISKEKILDDISRLPNAADREYLINMTSQWGRKDAVG